MDEEGEVKSREPAVGYPASPVTHAHPQAAPAVFSVPAPPPDATRIYPPGVAAAYPSPASAAYPPASTPPPVQPPYAAGPPYYSQGYQNYPGDGVAAAQTTTLKDERLPCWGLGFGWFLFIIGFFLAAIPWYAGALILIIVRVDYREKPGYIACTIAGAISAVGAFFYFIQPALGW